MDYKDLEKQSIADLVNNVQGFAAMASQPQVQSVAALFGRCTSEMAGSLANVWAGLHDVKAALVRASEGSSQQTAALVRWTKVLVFATIAYTVLTGGLLLATILK